MSKCVNALAIFDTPEVKGVVKFHECPSIDGAYVIIKLTGLKPSTKRAMHIHEFGDTRKGCMSLGPHWNPHKTTHGTIFIENMPRHAGDLLNNIEPDSKGEFSCSYHDPLINISGDIDYSIIGRSVVIHDGIDDLGLGGNEESLKTGNAGGRMTCAIIGRAEDGETKI
jgi:superoxide dismutase, Cu-Zn family